jgi:hypothetical protein
VIEHPRLFEQRLSDRQRAPGIAREQHPLRQLGRRAQVVRADLVLEGQGGAEGSEGWVTCQQMAGPADNLRDAVERTVEATVRGAEERLSKGRRQMTDALEGRRPATADDIKDLQKELRAIGRRLDRIEESLPKKRGGGSSKRGSKS